MTHPILYIHPDTDMMLREIIPMSLPALINRLSEPVIGRFHDEWTEDEIRAARIVLLDVHWDLSLRSAVRLSRQVKRINPGATIIAGGLSATLFAPQLLRDSPIDYVIRGDGEIPLLRLVDAVLHGKPADQVPNVVSRAFTSPNWYALTSEDLSAGNFRDISWFPSLEKGLAKVHRYSHGKVYPVHPFLMTYRGCPMGCEDCYGGCQKQPWLFRRGWVLRAPEKVKEDLAAWSDDPDMRFVNVWHDFISVLEPSYAEEVLDRTYDLDVCFSFFRLPTGRGHQARPEGVPLNPDGTLAPDISEFRLVTNRGVELLTNAFRGGRILFSLDQYHNTTDKLPDIGKLIECIQQAMATKRFEVWLGYLKRVALRSPEYAKALDVVVKETGCTPFRWDMCMKDGPWPNEDGLGKEEDYQECLRNPRPFFFFNRLCRAAVQVNRYAPAIMPTLTKLHRRYLK